MCGLSQQHLFASLKSRSILNTVRADIVYTPSVKQYTVTFENKKKASLHSENKKGNEIYAFHWALVL